jgi:hypothetical protein
MEVEVFKKQIKDKNVRKRLTKRALARERWKLMKDCTVIAIWYEQKFIAGVPACHQSNSLKALKFI